MTPWAVLFSLHLIANVQGLEVLRIPNPQGEDSGGWFPDPRIPINPGAGSSDPNKAVANATSCPAQAAPKRAGVDYPQWWDPKVAGQNHPCFGTAGFDSKMDIAHSCLTSSTVGLKESRAIYLIGDSHAAHLLRAFQKASKLPVFWLAWAKNKFDDPMKKLEADLRQVLSKDDVVVFNQLIEDEHDKQFYRQQFAALHNITSAVGAKIILIGDTPMWPQPIPVCLMKVTPGQESPCATDQLKIMSSQASRFIYFQDLKAIPDVFFFDALEHYCPKSRCDIFIPGTSTSGFFDFHHMGNDGSSYLAPFPCDFLLHICIGPGKVYAKIC